MGVIYGETLTKCVLSKLIFRTLGNSSMNGKCYLSQAGPRNERKVRQGVKRKINIVRTWWKRKIFHRGLVDDKGDGLRFRYIWIEHFWRRQFLESSIYERRFSNINICSLSRYLHAKSSTEATRNRWKVVAHFLFKSCEASYF